MFEKIPLCHESGRVILIKLRMLFSPIRLNEIVCILLLIKIYQTIEYMKCHFQKRPHTEIYIKIIQFKSLIQPDKDI